MISQTAKPFWKRPKRNLVACVPLMPTSAFGQSGFSPSIELVIAIIRAFCKLIPLANPSRHQLWEGGLADWFFCWVTELVCGDFHQVLELCRRAGGTVRKWVHPLMHLQPQDLPSVGVILLRAGHRKIWTCPENVDEVFSMSCKKKFP